jgi:FAD/FMN-containing dehydrogenase
LAVLKSFGNQGKGMLSFPMKGYTLSLDIPYKNESLVPFLHSLDDIVLRHGGRIYMAKDSLMKPSTFNTMYPRLGEFLKVLAEWDPMGRWSSSQAVRLGIKR